MIVAIFDLDGTLFAGHVWNAVARYHSSQRINRRWFYLYMLTHMPLYYLSKLGLTDEDRMRLLWVRDMAWSLRGFDEARAQSMFQWITDEYVMPLIRQDVMVRLRDHQSRGHHILLLSGAFEGLLKVVGARLGVEDVIGTRLIRRNGRYVGSVRPPVCNGEGKVQRLDSYLDSLDWPVDMDASYAYADSLTDRLVLERVGHPVAVYPEEGLAELAHEQGWSVLGSLS